MKRSLLSALLLSALPLASLPAQVAASPLGALVQALSKIEDPAVQANLLRGMQAAFKGRSGLREPAGWAELYAKLKESPNEEVRTLARTIGGAFGSGSVLEEMRRSLADASASSAVRRSALETLVTNRDAAALPALVGLVKSPGELRAPALRALGAYEDATVAPAILDAFASLDSAEKRDALSTLVSRPAHARALVAAIESGAVSRSEITAPLARQLQGLGDPTIDAWLGKAWGLVKTTSAEKQAQVAKYKEFLDPGLIGRADMHRGRALFAQVCASCHMLHGSGGRIGPELTGGYEDIDYLLQNILDPNAVIGKDYQQTFVTLKDGQVVSGIVTGEDATTLTLKTLADTVTIPLERIAERKLSEQSMMPEGLLAALDEPGVRDLFLYLRQKKQVVMLANGMNANDFFNGVDLTRWRPSGPNTWKVQGGEIVGRTSNARPSSLQSEMAADAFRFTAKVKVTGEGAAAEIILRGRGVAEGFVGSSLSLGGASPANVWLYAGRQAKPEKRGSYALPAGEWIDLEVIATNEQTELKLNGQPVAALHPGTSRRTVPGFYLSRGELRVRALKLEPVP